MLVVGIDVGGTHTDLYSIDDSSNDIRSAKAFTTPEDLTQGVLNSLAESNIDPADIDHFLHSSTTATNALIERTYPKTALITTEGFRDTIEIGHFHREHLYDPYQTKPEPLVPRRYRYTVPERVNADGEVTEELDEPAVADLAQKLADEGIETAAIGFNNSYVNSENEQRARELLQEHNEDLYVSISSEVSAKLGSVERFNTAIVNAALAPLLTDYYRRLEDCLIDAGFDGGLFIVKSSGGVMNVEAAKDQAETVVLSGPAAGARGAGFVGEALGQSNVIGMDMGGTSADISIIEEGEPLITTEYELWFDTRLTVPMIDVSTIGSGGGSIAWIDEGGSLRVGPQSAGADPGPACYPDGGDEPTITDANLLLGRLNADTYLSGDISLDEASSRSAMGSIANEFDFDKTEMAEAIIRIANENMAAAIREVTIERGRDPRDFVLVGFGGNGPMQSVDVAKSLSIPQVVIPSHPGVLSAMAETMMDIQYETEQTFYSPVASLHLGDLNGKYEQLEEQALESFEQENVDPQEVNFNRIAEMRYVGQTYEVDVPIPKGELEDEDIRTVAERFHENHETEYGVANEDFDIAFVNLRVQATAEYSDTSIPFFPVESEGAAPVSETRNVYINGSWDEKNIYKRTDLNPGHTIHGPAVVEEDLSTTLIDGNMTANVDEHRNIIVNIDS